MFSFLLCFSVFFQQPECHWAGTGPANVSYGTIAAKLKELCCRLAQSIVVEQQTADVKMNLRSQCTKRT
jgi:hypothetical protein